MRNNTGEFREFSGLGYLAAKFKVAELGGFAELKLPRLKAPFGRPVKAKLCALGVVSSKDFPYRALAWGLA